MKEVNYKVHILYDSVHIKCSEQTNLESESKLVVAKGWKK